MVQSRVRQFGVRLLWLWITLELRFGVILTKIRQKAKQLPRVCLHNLN